MTRVFHPRLVLAWTVAGMAGLLGLSWPGSAYAFSCSVAAADIDFGNIDVLANTVIDTTATITVSCEGGAPPRRTATACVSIEPGPLGDATSRVMTSPEGGTLRFDLYKDASRTTKFGSWQSGYNGSGVQLSVPYSNNNRLTVYARIFAAQQTVPAGSYSASFAGAVRVTAAYDTTTPCPTGNVTATGSFTASAVVLSTCYVDADDMNFGNLASLSSSTDAASTTSIRCSNGLPYTVSLGGGNANAADPTQRKMSKGAEQITYGLYRDAARSQPWGSIIDTNTASGRGSGTSQGLNVYGRVPVQTTPSPGTYSDTVVVTVTY